MNGLNFEWDSGVRHVSRRDRGMARVIRKAGEVSLRPRRPRTPFHALMRAIIFQQLSGKAAGTIHGRVIELFPDGRRVTPARLLAMSDVKLRGAGLSRNNVAA